MDKITQEKQHSGCHAARTELRIPGGFESGMKKTRQHMSPGQMLAERVGFEPTESCPSTDFESLTFHRTSRKLVEVGRR